MRFLDHFDLYEYHLYMNLKAGGRWLLSRKWDKAATHNSVHICILGVHVPSLMPHLFCTLSHFTQFSARKMGRKKSPQWRLRTSVFVCHIFEKSLEHFRTTMHDYKGKYTLFSTHVPKQWWDLLSASDLWHHNMWTWQRIKPVTFFS